MHAIKVMEAIAGVHWQVSRLRPFTL